MVEDDPDRRPREIEFSLVQTFYGKGHFLDALKEFATILKRIVEGAQLDPRSENYTWLAHTSIDNGFITRKCCSDHTCVHPVPNKTIGKLNLTTLIKVDVSVILAPRP